MESKSESETKKSLTNAERQKRYREKRAAVESNTYVKPLVDEAREVLRAMADPTIEGLQGNDPKMI